jgi:hypothetical protein
MQRALLDWWDMKPFPVPRLLELVRSFQESVSDPRSASAVPYDAAANEEAILGVTDLVKECEDCCLPSAADQFKRIYEKVSAGGLTPSELNLLLPEAMNRIQDECKRHCVMLIEPDYVRYFSDPQFFDSKDPAVNRVSGQFPSAGEDVAESGKCLACGRSTACVMHLNRVMEVGLRALAAALGIGQQNDWGKYLEGIDKELQTRMKASGARTPDEQFYAEAHAMFDSVRRAWRNPTMHVEKTYTEERAEEILIAVRSFMRHLATKLDDRGLITK